MANSYLTRTPSSASNRKTWTFSAWVKRSAIPDAAGNYLFQQSQAEGNYMKLYFHANKIYWRGQTGESNTAYKVTNRLFRDTSAWYHVVARFDSTQSTAGDRMRLYINGVEETNFSTNINPDLNHDSFCNTTNPMDIGRDNVNNGSYFDGYMSHVSFVDGQSLAPTSFGETDSTSGIWKFKSPSGVTWGTNGFHLKMENSGALGTDSSGNSNTFTVNGNLKQALDTPSNVYATLNPLASLPNTGVSTFTNGNTTSQGTNGSYVNGGSTLMMSSGKWYAEMKYVATSADSRCFIGITKDVSEISRINQDAGSNNTLYRSNNGNKNIQGSDSSYANSWTTGDIIGIALDLDNEKLYVSKNGTWQNSSDPTSGASGTGAITGFTTPASTVNGGYFFFSGSDSNAQNNTVSWNFGNGFFGTTAITSAGSNGNGSLFEYDVPSGYYALNTKNINSYG